jgi:hypothetical protein
MTRNAETPDTPVADARAAATVPVEGTREVQPGPIAELGLVSAGLGLVIYLIGFVADLGGSSSPILPLLLGGGLLAGTVALPTVGGRVLAPAAVITTTGALLLLRDVVGDGSALAVGALVLGLLEAGAAVVATLMQAGVLRSRPPKARKPAAFSGYPGGPQFPGQQYPGQPYPGAYAFGAPGVEPYPADQWTGEHAYAQNAQYGGQYGVPGYPPPPPFGTPGYDPAAQYPTVAVGTDTPDHDTASPPRGTRPVTEPVGGTGDAGSGYRSAADSGTGAHRAVPDPGAAAFRPSTDAAAGTGAHRAVADPAASGTGSFLTASRSVPEITGSHRAGSFPPAADTTPVSGTGSYRAGSADPARAEDDGDTRALPTVQDDQRQ